MRVDTAVRLMGGAASRADLLLQFPRTIIDAAVSEGTIVRASRGVYTTHKPDAVAIAHQLRGVVSHHTAADMFNMGTVRREPLLDITIPVHRSRVKAPKGHALRRHTTGRHH